MAILPSKLSDYLKLGMVLVVLGVVLLSGRGLWRHVHASKSSSDSYERCVKAGGKVEHKIPPVCTDKDGKRFFGSTEDMYQVIPQQK